MIKALKKLGLSLGVLMMATVFANTADAARFSLVPSSQEYTQGCEVAVDIRLDTEGLPSNGADAFINYDASEIELIDQNPGLPGMQIKAGNIYESYIGSVDEGNELIRLSAFSIFSQYNDNDGVYATIIFRSRPGVTSTQLTWDFTPGDTTDSNVAEFPSSDDILGGVTGGSYTFVPGFCGEDTVPPQLSNPQPANNSQNNPLDSDITFNLTDNLSGVDLDTLSVKVNSAVYNSSSPEFSVSGNSLNYAVTINPTTDFTPGIPVSVEVNVADIAGNTMPKFVWSFNHPVEDLAPPFVTNPSPSPGSQGVPLDANVTFRIKDLLSGVDISTVSVEVDGSTYQQGNPNFSFSGTPNDYFIAIDPSDDFPDGQGVTVRVDAEDLAGNTMATYTFTFNQPTVDTVPPFVRDRSPQPGARAVPVTTNVSFSVRDSGSGVDIDTVRVRIDGVEYLVGDSALSYTGDSANYAVVIDPPTDFTPDTAVTVEVDAIDLAGNVMNTVSWTFNKPAVCGDNLVELDFGEECEPPGTACCDSSCKIVEAVEDLCPAVPGVPGALPPTGIAPDAGGGILISTDTDGDGVSDAEEIFDFGTDPRVPDEFDINLGGAFIGRFRADTDILNWQDGDVSGTGRLFVKGIGPRGKNVKVFAIDENGTEIFLGEDIADEETKFATDSRVRLGEGTYLLKAESYESNGVLIEESQQIEIIVDFTNAIPTPVIQTINDQTVLQDVQIVIEDSQPAVFGRSTPNSMIFAVFESSMFTSTILSDGVFGFFTVFAPRALEPGPHQVTIYAISAQGVRSESAVVQFEVRSPGVFADNPWLWWILILILIFILIAAYMYWRKKKNEKELEELKKLGEEKDEQVRARLEEEAKHGVATTVGGNIEKAEEDGNKPKGPSAGPGAPGAANPPKPPTAG